MSVNPVPEGFHTITPQLGVEGAAKAIEFYKQAFGAEEIVRAPDPSGQKIWHAELRIGDSKLFVNDVFPDMDPSAKPSQSSLWLYVPDVDALFDRAVAAGAKPTMPPADMFWGDRMAHVIDPFGQKWAIAAHVRDVTPEEMKKSQDEMVAKMKEKR